MLASLERFRDEVEDGYVLGPVRATVGVLLGWQALAAAEELGRVGYFGGSFHLPLIPEAFVPSSHVYAIVLAARVCLAVMVVIGVWARRALFSSAVLGLWLLLCDRNQFDHGRYSLYVYAFLLSLTRCDRSWRASEPEILEPRRGPWWGVRLTQIQVSLCYFAAAGSKLLDAEWCDGLALSDRALRFGNTAFAHVPRGVVELLARPDIASAVAKLVITTELFVCIALWLKPVRVVAFWWGLWFHLIGGTIAKMGALGLLPLVLYGAFVTPDYRARKLSFDPSRFWGKLAGLVVPALDWFARFEVVPWEPDEQRGHSVVITRRDGRLATGMSALAMLTRCLPLLFPLWAPVLLLSSFTRRGDLTTRA
jgi:hypothetical protein